MKHVLIRTLATLILASASAATMASPVLSDSQTHYPVGDIAPSPRHLNVDDTFHPNDTQDRIGYSPSPNFIEGVGDPLERLPEQTWIDE